ncbi:MAG TPA: LpqB family beta-propeller domain-containing protein [Nocardioidaceae bacterium]|nr:LpqB family beta-propeller domain-containing protein [Nocardioidaceae bacterium]
MIRRLVVAALIAAVILLAAGGCVSLPRGGSVQAGPLQQQTNEEPPVVFTPDGPYPGESPAAIVRGFMSAMEATPVSTVVARQFLTSESSTTWVPEKATIVYRSQAPTVTKKGEVDVDLEDVTELDNRGEWLGDPTRGKGLHYHFHLERQKGQWRISHPPDALIVSRTHFESLYQQYFLYYFDKTTQVLVPEPVYLPGGEQVTTLLVQGLLRGPDQDLLGTERTYIPSGTKLSDISVPVSHDGVADVPLSQDILGLDDQHLTLAFAQLAWTLKQVSGVERMRITVDGSPLDLSSQGPDVPVDTWSEYDPAVEWATQALFGLRAGKVVIILDGHEHRVSGVFGALKLGVRSIGVDLSAQHIAAVTNDGTTVLSGDRNRIPGTLPTKHDVRTIYSGGTDVLRPSFDLYDTIWLVDRTSDGARVSVVHDGKLRALDVPGISGTHVKRFVVSRDGTRLIAVVHGKHRDLVLESRIRRDHSGKVRGVLKAVRLPLRAQHVREIRDIAWRTPAAVAVLTGPSPGSSQVLVLSVDGSEAGGDVATDAQLFADHANRLVTSPLPGAPLYIGTKDGQLFSLAPNGRWTGAGIRAGLGSPTFVG